MGAASPPPSLLPGVEEPAGVGAGSTSTEAPQLGAQEGTAGPSVGPAAGDEAEESKGLDTEPELTDEEKAEVDELKDRDREVRQHEQAHMAAAGPYAKGGPSYEYTRGPDGKRYAVGGEVQIDTSKESDPEATIRKAQQIYRAALAPAEPSSQDRSVASQAKKMEMEARSELREQQDEEGTLGAEGSAAEEDTPATQEPSEGPASIDLPGSGPSSDSEPNAGFVGSHASAPGPSSSGSSPSMQGLLDLLA
ncbi:MAG TPA: catalase [Candidatus Latescibacteria bacterium]|nr:catalase [Candidatus Latescibacterota bacterium]